MRAVQGSNLQAPGTCIGPDCNDRVQCDLALGRTRPLTPLERLDTLFGRGSELAGLLDEMACAQPVNNMAVAFVSVTTPTIDAGHGPNEQVIGAGPALHGLGRRISWPVDRLALGLGG